MWVVLALFIMIICGAFQLLGVGVYINGYQILAGYNTMTSNDSKNFEEKQDTDRLSSFIGISFCIISYVSFIVYMTLGVLFDAIDSLFWGTLIFALLLTIFAIFINTTKRFEKKKSI